MLPRVRRRRLVPRAGAPRTGGCARAASIAAGELAAARLQAERASLASCVRASERRAALETQRATAARGADQRRDVPGAARQRAGAQLDQRRRVAAAGDLPERRRDELPRPATAAQAEFRTEPRHVVARRGPAADRRRRARDAAAARVHRAAPAGRGPVQPAVPAARARDGARPGARRGRAGAVSQVGRQLLGAVVSKLLFAFLLGVVLAVCAILEDLGGARLVDAVAADVSVLVGRVRAPPSGARPAGRRTAPAALSANGARSGAG